VKPIPLRVKKTRQNKKPDPGFDFTGVELARIRESFEAGTFVGCDD
jgi:hypothetical protein